MALEILSSRNLPSADVRLSDMCQNEIIRAGLDKAAGRLIHLSHIAPPISEIWERLRSVTATDKTKRLTSETAKSKVLQSDRRMMVSIKGDGLENKSLGFDASDWKSWSSWQMQISWIFFFSVDSSAVKNYAVTTSPDLEEVLMKFCCELGKLQRGEMEHLFCHIKKYKSCNWTAT